MVAENPRKFEFAPTEAEVEQARSEREALKWLRESGEEGLETLQRGGAASTTPISTAAFDIIVEFEVSSEAVYTKKYRGPIWPRGASGVTIGIGYDVGYATKPQLHADFGDAIPDAMIRALEVALDVTGAPAQQVAHNLRDEVDVPWSAAISVHRFKVMPRWIGLVERSLPNTKAIGPDCLGALASLTYNRGASFAKNGDRYTEMRAIKTHMAGSAFDRIPAEIRAMKRIWPDVLGLQKRREREARLFEAGLRNT